ncbi:MAG: hypothetical protein LBQ58_08995 [Synergistaceae bacterium]|nr:hypothetical protein [Synergistaceae bacterium]
MKRTLFLAVIVVLSLGVITCPVWGADFVRVQVVGKNINVRSAPNLNGKVLGQLSDWSSESYIAAMPPIKDKSGSWYQLFFSISDYGDYHHYQLKKSMEFNYTAPYINAKYIKVVPLTADDKRQIDWYSKGRPVRHQTGERLSGSTQWSRVATVKQPFTLLLEPQKSAKKKTFPAGTRIFVYDGPDTGGFAYEDGILFYSHTDMEENQWQSIVGEDKRIIGWIGGRMTGNDIVY